MDAEVPVNYVPQLSGHKNLKSLESYKTASHEHQRKMSLVVSSGTEKSHNSSNAAPVNSAVKAWQPLKQREEKPAFLGEAFISSIFAGSDIRRIQGSTFNFSFNSAPCSSGESSDQSKPRKGHVIISDSDSD